MLLKILLPVAFLIVTVNAKPYKAKKIADKTIHFSDGVIKKGGHRNWRNNNPGNLEYGKFAREHGAIGSDGRFAIFPNMLVGYKAHIALFSGDKYKNLTLRQALKRFAPSFENNTRRYLSYIHKHTGISTNKRLKYLSFNDKLKLVKYMAKYEGMKRGIAYKSSLNYKKTRNLARYAENRKKVRTPRVENKYVMAQTRKRYERLLNPKKTRLHKILLSN